MVLLSPRFSRTGRCARSDRLEKREVLRVARPHLEHVGVFRDDPDIGGCQHLGDHREPRRLACLGEVAKPLDTEPSKRVRRRARLERAAADHRGSGGGNLLCRRQHLLAAFHGAWTGDDHEGSVAEGHTGHVDHRRFGVPLARDLLVGLAHRDRIHHPGKIADGVPNRARIAAEDPDREAVGARQLDRLEPALTHVLHDVGDLVGRRLHVHEHQHRLILRQPALKPTSSCRGSPAIRRHPRRNRPGRRSARFRRCCPRC